MGYLREFMLKKGTQMATLSHKFSRIITVYSNNSANFAVRASPRKWVATILPVEQSMRKFDGSRIVRSPQGFCEGRLPMVCLSP